MKGSYPDFFCLGFQKCGTTTLHDIFSQHPEVTLCRDVKEPMFYRLPVVHLLLLRYHYYNFRYFKHVSKSDDRLKGEINAGLTFAGCARRLRFDLDGHAKMLFMMRHPAHRSYSAYKYFIARGFLPRDVMEDDLKCGHAEAFDRYVRSVLENTRRRDWIAKNRLSSLVFSQSCYASRIEEYRKYFDNAKIKYIFFEDFIRDQHQTCRDIFEFLGISDFPNIEYGRHLNGEGERFTTIDNAKRLYLVKGMNYVWFELANLSKWLPRVYERYHRKYMRQKDISLTIDDDSKPMLDGTRDYLMDYYMPEIKRLEAITGRDLKKLWAY